MGFAPGVTFRKSSLYRTEEIGWVAPVSGCSRLSGLRLGGWHQAFLPAPSVPGPEAGWVAPTWALLLALHSENSAYTELKKLVGWPRCLAPVSGCPRLSGLKLGGLKLGGWHLSSRHLRGNDGACDTGFPPARSRFCGIFPTKCPEPAKLADFACGV